MLEMDIDQVIHLQRIGKTSMSFLLLFYTPLGVLLVIFRLFLTLNYLCSQLIFNVVCSKGNFVRRIFERLFLAMLGVIVIQRNHSLRDKKSLLISNKASKVDAFFIGVLCNCSVVTRKQHGGIAALLFRSTSIEDASRSETFFLAQPEHHPNSGSALLKFSEWPFVSGLPVQPVAVRLKRPFPIAGSTLESSWWQDLLWMYFCIVSIYDVTTLRGVRQASDELKEDFADRVRINIAGTLAIPCSVYDAADVKELLKKRKFEARKPQEHLRMSAGSSPIVREMVKKVKDILPHVPVATITADIEKTRSVDVTVTNLLEGVVKFEPEDTSSTSQSVAPTSRLQPKISKESSFSKNPDHRHLSLQERKDALMERARETYLRKRDIS